MHRIPPKVDLSKMPAFTSDRGLAVRRYQQNGGFHHLPQTKEKIKTLLLKFPMGIEMEKFVLRYQESYGEKLVPQTFGFTNLEEMLKSLYEMIDLRPKVARERRVVILKSAKSKGTGTVCKSGKKKAQKNHLLLVLAKERLSRLLEKHPHGLYIEKISMAYKMKYGEELVPQTFGFHYLLKMLQSFQDILEVRIKKPEEMRWILYLKSTKEDVKPDKMGDPSTKPLHEVVMTFHSIINNLGGIEVDALIPEYEARTGQKLNVQELGFVSLPSFLSQMSEVLKTLKKDGKVIVVDSAVNIEQPSVSQEPTSTAAEEADAQSDTRLMVNLRQLLEEELPCGLRLDELHAAYEGFYGMSGEDLDYEKHGYGSLRTFLASKPDVVTLLDHQGSVYILPSQPFKSPSPGQMNLSHTGQVVEKDERYSVVGKLALGRVEVVVGEVYTPQHFWVVHYGEHTSLELDRLMDRMLDFYGSSLGERYRLQETQVTNHMPVAALYKPDNNFYRAFVLSVEDLNTVKLFFVDYGTICISNYDCLHLLPRKFFALPAQAIKCSLYGVVPPKGRRKWSHECSKRFLIMVQNQRLMAEVMEEQMTTVIQLWDTSHGKDSSIAELLVTEGLASLSHPPDENSDPHTPETVATSPTETPAAQITVKDLNVAPNVASQTETEENQEASSQEQPHEVILSTAKYTDVQRSNITSTQEHAFDEVPNTVPDMEVQKKYETSSQEQAFKGSVPNTREAQTDTSDMEAVLASLSSVGVQGSSLPSTQEQSYEESLPSTRKAATNTVDLSLIDRSSCLPSFEAAAADDKFLVSSTPKKSPSSPSHRCKCESHTEPHFDGMFLNDNSFLVQSLDITLNQTLRVIQLDGISYVLDVDLPHVKHDQVDHLGITLKKESDQDIYLLLVESGFNIFESGGKFRPSIIIYPFRHLPGILAHSGYHMDGYYLSKDVEGKESTLGNLSAELLALEKRGYGQIPSMESSRGSSLQSGSVETKTFYKHGAQVEPLRRPFTTSPWSWELTR